MGRHKVPDRAPGERGEYPMPIMMLAVSLGLFVAAAPTLLPLQEPDPAPAKQEEAAAMPVELPSFGAIPNEHQLAWHDKTFYAFIHFGPNTFTGVEWGEGKENPDEFVPTDFDAGQWARSFKAAGMTGVVITAKHHDGFCLWPSDVTTHDVASSRWLEGQGDVLKSLSDACREEGLWFGVYLSPWDKHEPTYGTGTEYNEHFAAQLKEALTRYGDVAEVWFDGANGEGPNGKRQIYDWERFVGVVREHQPGAVIFSDAGPDIRWCGNERAIGNETNWATLNRDEITLGTSKTDELNAGHQGGTHWVPYECNTSIRPGWFWKAGLDDGVKSLEVLLDTWYASVGRGGNFLLNVPPDQRGQLVSVDVDRLALLGKVLAATHERDVLRSAVQRGGAVHSASNVRGGAESMDPTGLIDPSRDVFWSVDDGHDAEGNSLAWVEFRLPDAITFDEVWLEEPIQLGQRVTNFRVLVPEDETVEEGPRPGALAVQGNNGQENSAWREVTAGTTIGARRILRFDPVTARHIRVAIDGALATPALSRLSLYLSPSTVKIEPASGTSVTAIPVTLTSRPGLAIRYTLDGSEVTASSPIYAKPLVIQTSAHLRAKAFDGANASPLEAEADFKVLAEADWKAAIQFIQPPTPGLRAALFEGGWQTLDQMRTRDPMGVKETASFDVSVVTRLEQCALRFEGFLKVPQDGLYTLALVSDDGSRMYLHDELVVDNDGLHGMVRQEGRIALRKGHHPIRVEWFNARGAAGLEVRWSGPGVGRDQPIPETVLFR
ncbi:MAG: alpha-L-fucosidase [Planctomycetota bacterium]